MTVSTSDITSGPYTGTGALDEYSYDFTVQSKSQLEVFETTDAGVRTTLTVDVDYTVNDVGVEGGGTITRLAGNLPTDYIWYIRSNYAEDQQTDLTALGPFSPAIHELQFDHLTYLVKQLSDKLGRALTFTKELIAPAGVDTTLPPPEASKIAAVWNSAGTALEIGPTTDEISNAQGYATAAAVSAASAAATYETFDDRYLGEHASNPTTLNDGITVLDASHDGIEYWDSTLKVRKTFNGSTLLWGLTSASAATNAADVNIADAGGYYTGTDVEAALQEVGAEFAANQVVTDTMLKITDFATQSWTGSDITKEFTGIPSTAKRITVMVDKYSNNAASAWQMSCAIGTSSSYTASGRSAVYGRIDSGGTNVDAAESGSGLHPIMYTGGSLSQITGVITYTRVGTSNTWLVTANMIAEDTANGDTAFTSSGTYTFPDVIDRVKVVGTGTPDSGEVSVMVEHY